MAFEHETPAVTSTTYADADYIRGAMLGLEFLNTPAETESLNVLAESASRIIDNYTQNIFYEATFVQEKKVMKLDFYSRIVLRVENAPIKSVESIVIRTVKTDRITIPEQFLDIHPRSGIIRVNPLGLTSEGVLIRTVFLQDDAINTVITYTGGQPTPSPVKRACAMLVRNLLMPGELSAGIAKQVATNQGDIKRVKSKSYEEEYDTTKGTAGGMKMSVTPEKDFLLTSDIRAILTPYVKRGIL